MAGCRGCSTNWRHAEQHVAEGNRKQEEGGDEVLIGGRVLRRGEEEGGGQERSYVAAEPHRRRCPVVTVATHSAKARGMEWDEGA